MFNTAKIIPLITQLGTYLKSGMDHYADLRQVKKEASPEIVAAFIQIKMADWNPKFDGKALLDSDTREAGARFLAGLAVNLVGDK
jgi:hypothetical protein